MSTRGETARRLYALHKRVVQYATRKCAERLEVMHHIRKLIIMLEA
jgi:hypothetical protein